MDRAELRAEIARKRVSKRELAAAIGISEMALYNKLEGKSEFKESQIKILSEILSLSVEDVDRIFFR